MSKKTNKRNVPKVAKKQKITSGVVKEADAVELLGILERIRNENKVISESDKRELFSKNFYAAANHSLP